jgi:hypothetical protein
MLGYTCDASIWEIERRESQILDQPGYVVRPCLQQQQRLLSSLVKWTLGFPWFYVVANWCSLFQLVTGVWEGKYNFFCQGTRSAGESDMKVGLSSTILRYVWFSFYF